MDVKKQLLEAASNAQGFMRHKPGCPEEGAVKGESCPCGAFDALKALSTALKRMQDLVEYSESNPMG